MTVFVAATMLHLDPESLPVRMVQTSQGVPSQTL